MAFPNRKYLRYKTVELIEAGESFLKENNIIELKEIQYEIFCRRRPYTARKLEDIKTRIIAITIYFSDFLSSPHIPHLNYKHP